MHLCRRAGSSRRDVLDGRRTTLAPAPRPASARRTPSATRSSACPTTLSRRTSSAGTDLLLTTRFALAATRQALADAGWDPGALRRLRVGVCLGTTVGSALNIEDFYREYRAGGSPDLETIERFLRSNPAAAVSRELGLDGPVQTVVNACSSGTDAIGIAASWLRAGVCDVVLAGGADELCRIIYNGFISLMITDDQPCRPFDRERRGLNLGEGAAVLVLERPSGGGGPRRPDAGPGARVRLRLRRAPPDGAAPGRAGVAPGLRRGPARRAGVAAARGGVHQRPRHRHPRQRPGRGTGDSRPVPGDAVRVDQGLHRPHARRRRGDRGRFHGGLPRGRAHPGQRRLRGGRPRHRTRRRQPPEREIHGDVAISDSLAFGGNNAVLVIGRADR